ncbi:hypothetical protein [Salipiger mangrovisoli]|uniref:Secreted protein n=1 Tax=Salipiger mangrovisoli TaxID=2865933 RepID=A0ABR9X3T1_9RHOB|nr:hypothetical protein [Salipiger mangrovisoli]MBE9638244.1 hypothetical protein [Salipiger mangrovisoli]
MCRIACLVPLLISLAAPLWAQGTVVDLDAAERSRPFRWPERPGWPARPDRPGHPHRPGWPGSGGITGWGGYGGLGLSIDLGTRVPGADGSVREPVMTIERDSPARTKQIRNSPGAPVVSGPAADAPQLAARAAQPPIVERAPATTSPALPAQALQGVGELNGGGSALGQVLSSDGENYVLLLTLPDTRITCLGQLDGPPALFPSMGSALACTDGAQGNALFATPEEGIGSSASFTLDGGRGGYLIFP